MKTLHLLGHNHKWNLDAHFQNEVGEGFVFCAYSFENGFAERETLSGYKMNDVLKTSMLDLQFFGKKDSADLEAGKLKSYEFHPCTFVGDTGTNEYVLTAIKNAIKYQIGLGLQDIIIPNYYENENIEQFIGLIKNVNKWLEKNKKGGHRYFMSVPITNHTIIDSDKIEKILYALTDRSILFDGYYIVCESKPEFKQKISTDIKYLRNLTKVLSVLKKQNFITVYAYANWDAAIFLTLTDIDYITIGSYENLRNFNIKRFLSTEDGGPSKGWYFSEKLLNFVKAQFIDLIREKRCIPLVSNERNMFSDIILDANFPWNNHKPEVHKNYLLAANKLYYELAAEKNMDKRKYMMLKKINSASENYAKLEEQKVFLLEESKNYHLAVWESFLLSR
ncbi:MAG: hypothetical protein ACK50A_01875 [Sphingobacteriaceae bacterium]|jgi:hypothetical protein